MIPRYSRPQCTKIWSDENKYNIWLQIEAYALEAMEQLGQVPAGTAKIVWEKAKFDVARTLEIEQTTKHDVIAFLTNLAENIGPEARFLHQGMTSSDVLDTCYSMQLTQSIDLIIEDLGDLLSTLEEISYKHKDTICVGRSHGIHAEPVTFGLKMATYYAEFERNMKRLQEARKEVAVCAISGAVGTFANIDPFVQDYVAEKMGLASETISTQVIPRDRYAAAFATFAVVAGSIERLATEIRHMQRTEVLEVEEFFAKGQKGSSAMPHKRNPVLSENLTGLARMIRGYAVPALENIALWHERDISHSSVERMIGPDCTVLLDFALTRLTDMMANLQVYPQNMEKNLNLLNGLVFSQRVLLALIEAGVSRENAYALVQRNAMKVWEKGASFLELLNQDSEVTDHLSEAKLASLFDISYHTKNIDHIFKSVFGE